MEIKPQIQSQYHASLEMLRGVVEKYPEEGWNTEEDKNKAWQIAYHALFYTHFYLHKEEAAYKPWPKHRQDAISLEPAKDGVEPEPYTKTEVLDFLSYLRQRVDEMVEMLDLEADSGFYWLPFDKLELQFYNIRHLMLHTGELAERLWATAEEETRWVGKRPEAS